MCPGLDQPPLQEGARAVPASSLEQACTPVSGFLLPLPTAISPQNMGLSNGFTFLAFLVLI